MEAKIIEGKYLIHNNEIYTRRVIGSESARLNLSDKEKEKFSRLRKIIDDNHPMRKFKDMLEEKLKDQP